MRTGVFEIHFEIAATIYESSTRSRFSFLVHSHFTAWLPSFDAYTKACFRPNVTRVGSRKGSWISQEDSAFGGRYNVGGQESGYLYASEEWEQCAHETGERALGGSLMSPLAASGQLGGQTKIAA